MIDTEQGPDPNQLRRHAKRMFTNMQYRKKYRRIDFYSPNRKQAEFHNLIATERMLRAGNQLGKTHAVGAQMVMDSLRWYPEWYKGRRYNEPPRIERPFDFLGWCACTTSVTTRDGAQTKLLGDVREANGLGTGLIPLDSIVGRPTMARGIADFVDSVTLSREGGGKAVIRFKTFEMDRKAFQGEPVDEIWIDEDPGDDTVYGECLARLTTTNGQIVVSMTPVLGLSPLRKRFKGGGNSGSIREVLMTIDDAAVSNGGHVPDEHIRNIINRYKESERQTRAYGADMQGEGAVFETPIERIKHALDPAAVPPYWPWLWGVDFRHSGSVSTGHPFAAVLGAWDRDSDIIYIFHAVRMLGLAPLHAAAMKSHPMSRAPVAWPHDGGRGGSLIDGTTIAGTYKKLGLNMRGTHATFADGGFNFEAGIDAMANRFETGRLKIASHLHEIFDEYQGYHRKDGLVVKVDDDLLSAIRQLVMDIRFAKTTTEFRGPTQFHPGWQRPQEGRMCSGLDFDLFTGQ